MKTATEKLKSELRKKDPKEVPPPSRSGLSTGLTLLNLACTGKATVGLLPSYIYVFVGDSQAGKSWLLLQILAEAAYNPLYDKYQLIHDDPEDGALMDVTQYFGALSKRKRPPTPKGPSSSLDAFYDNVKAECKEGKPFIHGLDSEDALDTKAEIERRKSNSKKNEKKGSFGTERARMNSSRLRELNRGIKRSKSIVIIIKQTRENIGHDAMFNPKTRSGGKGLTFYATLELWFSIRGKIKKTALGQRRIHGSILRIHVKKNRVVGQDRVIDAYFYPGHGFDDIATCVQWLIKEKVWEGTEDTVVAPEFKFNGKIEKLIEKIDQEDRHKELQLLVTDRWQDIEDALRVKRKKRYA